MNNKKNKTRNVKLIVAYKILKQFNSNKIHKP